MTLYDVPIVAWNTTADQGAGKVGSLSSPVSRIYLVDSTCGLRRTNQVRQTWKLLGLIRFKVFVGRTSAEAEILISFLQCNMLLSCNVTCKAFNFPNLTLDCDSRRIKETFGDVNKLF